MQTTTGANAGNFVLWMQPNGALNPQPTPADSPNPVRRRCVRLAGTLDMGHGRRVRDVPRPRSCLCRRARAAHEPGHEHPGRGIGGAELRSVLHNPRLSHAKVAHWGRRRCLIRSACSAFPATLRQPAIAEAKKLADSLGTGIAALQLGTAGSWPWQAMLPWARSVSDWHAYEAHMSMALAIGGPLLGHPDWVAAAERDANLFEVHQQLSFGPINGLEPAPDDLSQIAYGVEATADGLLSLGNATHNQVYRQLAGFAASWFFGNNPANVAMYQAATGVVYDGINSDGTRQPQLGCRIDHRGTAMRCSTSSTIPSPHVPPVRSCRLRDVLPEVRGRGRHAHRRRGGRGSCTAWTGEAQWSGNAYVRHAGGCE